MKATVTLEIYGDVEPARLSQDLHDALLAVAKKYETTIHIVVQPASIYQLVEPRYHE